MQSTMSARRRPPSVRGHWTLHSNGVLIGAFPTRLALVKWLGDKLQAAETTLRVPLDSLDVVDHKGTTVTNPLRTVPNPVVCDVETCGAVFSYVAARRYPTLCAEHAEELSRARDGWTPENSTD